MALSIIRKLTDEDTARLAAMHARFAARHDLSPINVDDLADTHATQPMWDGQRHAEIWPETRRYLGKLYLACFRRAVRHASADSTGWGYLGWYVA